VREDGSLRPASWDEALDEVAERLRSYGHEDFVSYVAWACERGLERGLGQLPDARADAAVVDAGRGRALAI